MNRTIDQINEEWKPGYDDETSSKYSKIVSSCFDELRHDDSRIESSKDFFKTLAEMIAETGAPMIMKIDAGTFFEELFLLLRETPKPARRDIYEYFTDEETLQIKAFEITPWGESEYIPGVVSYTDEYEEILKEGNKFYNFLEEHNYV